MNIIQKINPINKEEEKRKFFFDPLYNPQFEYAEEIDMHEYSKYGEISDRLLKEAQYIADAVLKKFGSESEFLNQVEGIILTREEVEKHIKEYLQREQLEDKIQVIFSHNFLSRTSMQQNIMRIRLPIEYRSKTLEGVLNHEIGTHYFRTLNEQTSSWYNNRKEFGLGEYIETEEGLAIIHQMVGLEEPYLWMSSLYYLATWWAKEMSFVELNKSLSRYIDDPHRRWKLCLKVKRGLRDTSKPGGFSRQQLYFSGVYAVIKWLEMHNFDVAQLYQGKVSVKQVALVVKMNENRKLVLPSFASLREQYISNIKKIKTLNHFAS